MLARDIEYFAPLLEILAVEIILPVASKCPALFKVKEMCNFMQGYMF